jgi:hypothetical protein
VTVINHRLMGSLHFGYFDVVHVLCDTCIAEPIFWYVIIVICLISLKQIDMCMSLLRKQVYFRYAFWLS